MGGAHSAAQLEHWERDGFFVVPGFAPAATLESMRTRALELVREADAGRAIGNAYVVPESALAESPRAEDRVSKVFRVHRDEPVFHAFATDARLLDLVGAILGENLDCFLHRRKSRCESARGGGKSPQGRGLGPAGFGRTWLAWSDRHDLVPRSWRILWSSYYLLRPSCSSQPWLQATQRRSRSR